MNKYFNLFKLRCWDYLMLIIFRIVNFNRSKICIVDIDNTLANSWPSLLIEWSNERERYMNLRYFPQVLEEIIKVKEDGYSLLFLSARPFQFYSTTKHWLDLLPRLKGTFQLYLVSNPFFKLKFLYWFNLKKEILFFDDLSYNHEGDCLLFYEDCINKMSELNIKYYDYFYLKTLQKSTRKK